jgi:hypothetical protein
LPTYLIAGLPKCGTTALAAYLETHPEVFVAPQKEVHFFDQHFARGIPWYRSQFAGATAERAVGEATPTYMMRDDTVARIASVVPDVRLIVVLRNPVDRALSHYWWMRGAVGFERRDFEVAARAEMLDPTGATTRPHFGYLEGSRYAAHLDRLYRSFPPQAVHVVIAEDLRRAGQATFAGVCRFLGVTDDFQPPNIGAVVNRAFRRRSETLHLAMLRTRAWRWLPMARWIDHRNRVELSYEPLDPGLRHELMAWFSEDTARLSAALGRDLSQTWQP